LANGGRAAAEQHLFSILRKVVEDAAEAIVVTEAQLEKPGPRILWVNPAFTEITGYDREEVIGKTPRILQGPETESAVLRRLRRRLQAGERFEGEAINYRKDETTFVNHWSIAPVHDEEGTIAYWVSIQRDVTEKRRLEREVLSAQEEERRRVGRMLHDSVGAELASAGMMLDNVLADLEDEAAVKSLEKVRASVERGYENLRSLSRGLSPVDLSEGSLVIALEQLASTIPEARFEGVDEELEEALADWSVEAQAHLYWIVKEAATNAQKHADARTIAIRGVRKPDELVLSVEDDGTGSVPEEESEEGWGLRTMAYRADLVGADLEIDARPGEGTSVICTVSL
jgi:PAS domain S-box-containing protein